MSKKRPPIQFNDEQLLLQASNVADIYHQLALDLFDNVVERVTERGTVYLDKQPYIWQLEKMQQMHMLNEENLKLISKYSGVAEEQLRYIVENEGLRLYTDTKQQLLEDLGHGSAGNSNHIQEILADYASQAVGDIHNLINTTLPMSVIGAYKGIVEQSVARVVTGFSTADKAISDTVMQWQEKGFQGFKDRAGRNWKIDNYARTVIKTTTYRTYREMRTRPAEELGIDTFYFSKKASARKSCAPLQHHIVTTGHARTEHGEHILALSDYGYGRPEGCLGINCGHMLTPFIPGANYKPDLGEDVDSVSPEQAKENANAEAKQRALERSIRANKEKLHIAEKLGDDDLINKYKSKIDTQNTALKDYIDKHPFLKRDEAREKYYDDPYTKAKKEVKVRKKLEKLEKHRAEQKEMRERFTNAVKDGIIKAEINEQKQADHIKGTNEWRRRLETELANGNQIEPSYLTISMDEAAELIKRYSGTGKFLYKEDSNYIPKKEIIKHNSKVGVYIDQQTGEMFETDSFRIHYRKTGAHIVPTYGGKS
ncbi:MULTISPECIES: phage minor capsid protein [unclassified Streptococcus]|uniref:phage minor capsid protein n=1 Tax=unclassified Streptococcus TaxID=2608887 RepID=UPI0020C8AC3E|nr:MULTISPECIES: phage minor capsid protein [unclassified Streptococcus]MCP9060394.1 polymorphic toxin type 50 domain-containing protein [Streptococcus sp. CF7_Ac1-12]MCP9084975.1 polymorphic toxin type 50 domain-containing protein [Streptococcus sp. CF7_Ac1-8]